MSDFSGVSRPSQKSTNGRFFAFGAALLALSALLAASPAPAAEPAGDLPAIGAEERRWAEESVPADGADASRLRKLHSALLARDLTDVLAERGVTVEVVTGGDA